MTRLAVTTIVRRAELGEPSGYLHVVDLDSDGVPSKTVVPESVNRARDPNA
jgi:hypothetical protein